MTQIDRIVELLERIVEQNDEIISHSRPTTPREHSTDETSNPTREKILTLLKGEPDRWFQPKELMERGVRGTAQIIASTLKAACRRGEVVSERRSVALNFSPDDPYAYDPMLYKWRG